MKQPQQKSKFSPFHSSPSDSKPTHRHSSSSFSYSYSNSPKNNINFHKKRKRALWIQDYFINHPQHYRKIKKSPPPPPSPPRPKTEFDSLKPVFKNSNPNYRYNSTIITTNDSFPLNSKFDVFCSINDGRIYLVSPNFHNYYLEVILLGFYRTKLITRLKGHKYYVTFVKYFLDKENKKEYLISADGKKYVIVWDINNIDKYDVNNEKIKKIIISTKYKNNFIYSCFLFFNLNKPNIDMNSNSIISTNSNSNSISNSNSLNNNSNNYIVTSSISRDIENEDFTRVYSLEDGSFIKNTYNNNTNFLLSWTNKNEDKPCLIELCNNGFMVYNILEETTYMEVKDDKNYMSGFIYEKEQKQTDLLVTNLLENFIYIHDLNLKNLKQVIETNASGLYYLIQLNEIYFAVTELYSSSFLIIDGINYKVISRIKGRHSGGTTCIKKCTHPLHGESLLTSGKDNSVKLWVKNLP